MAQIFEIFSAKSPCQILNNCLVFNSFFGVSWLANKLILIFVKHFTKTSFVPIFNSHSSGFLSVGHRLSSLNAYLLLLIFGVLLVLVLGNALFHWKDNLEYLGLLIVLTSLAFEVISNEHKLWSSIGYDVKANVLLDDLVVMSKYHLKINNQFLSSWQIQNLADLLPLNKSMPGSFGSFFHYFWKWFFFCETFIYSLLALSPWWQQINHRLKRQ